MDVYRSVGFLWSPCIFVYPCLTNELEQLNNLIHLIFTVLIIILLGAGSILYTPSILSAPRCSPSQEHLPPSALQCTFTAHAKPRTVPGGPSLWSLPGRSIGLAG